MFFIFNFINKIFNILNQLTLKICQSYMSLWNSFYSHYACVISISIMIRKGYTGPTQILANASLLDILGNPKILWSSIKSRILCTIHWHLLDYQILLVVPITTLLEYMYWRRCKFWQTFINSWIEVIASLKIQRTQASLQICSQSFWICQSTFYDK
jgi:hypothetical protein